jgi:hypothetical protein
VSTGGDRIAKHKSEHKVRNREHKTELVGNRVQHAANSRELSVLGEPCREWERVECREYIERKFSVAENENASAIERRDERKSGMHSDNEEVPTMHYS